MCGWRWAVSVLLLTGIMHSGCRSSHDDSNGTDNSQRGTTKTTFSVSGTISYGTGPLAGVMVALGGTSSASTSTDAGGNYSFSELPNGSYTATPLKSGYTFTPSSLAITVDGSDVTDRNFTATAASSWSLLKLPDTGQTGDYTSTVGEDSDYAINPRSFTDNGDDTVTDNVTSLIWQKQDDGIGKTWENAIAYCEGLDVGGQTDWRMPDDIELMSIVDYGQYTPAVDDAYFPNTQSMSPYWSSITHAGNTDMAWAVDFRSGFIAFTNKTYSLYVRCVRGGQ